MKALFLGRVAADTLPGSRTSCRPGSDTEIIAEPIDRARLRAAAADADILVGNHWRADFPPAPRLRLVQSIATGIELMDLAAVPRGVSVCNSFGHETAIAEYVIMTMLALPHLLFRSRASSAAGSWAASWVQGGGRTARCAGRRSASSAMAGSGARWRAAPRRSAAASSPRAPHPLRAAAGARRPATAAAGSGACRPSPPSCRR